VRVCICVMMIAGQIAEHSSRGPGRRRHVCRASTILAVVIIVVVIVAAVAIARSPQRRQTIARFAVGANRRSASADCRSGRGHCSDGYGCVCVCVFRVARACWYCWWKISMMDVCLESSLVRGLCVCASRAVNLKNRMFFVSSIRGKSSFALNCIIVLCFCLVSNRMNRA
jgi:hypothetical protein